MPAIYMCVCVKPRLRSIFDTHHFVSCYLLYAFFTPPFLAIPFALVKHFPMYVFVLGENVFHHGHGHIFILLPQRLF